MNYYTYLWLREDGTPYYVGKGSDRRAFKAHRSRKIQPPKERSRILIQHWDSEIKAFDMEKAFIRFFGRKDLGTGILRNLTEGGEGLRNISSETRQRMRDSHLGVKLSSSHRRRQSEARRGVKHSPEHAAAISSEKMGHQVSLEARRKMSDRKKGKPWTEARRACVL